MAVPAMGKTVLQLYTDKATRDRIEKVGKEERRKSLSDVLGILVDEALTARDKRKTKAAV